MSNAESSSSYENHPVHYFEDGNIIFILESKVLFKLYRGAISKQSEVFSDMLSVPQPAGDKRGSETSSNSPQELIDGVPAIHLTDTTESFAAVLDIVLPSPTPDLYQNQRKGSQTFSLDHIMSILELSQKYCMPTAESWAKLMLGEKYPVPKAQDLKIDDSPWTVFGSGKEAAKLIQVARKYDLPRYLPIAFYFLATSPNLEAMFQAQILSAKDQARLHVGRMRMIDAVIDAAANQPENGIARGPPCPLKSKNGQNCVGGNVDMKTIWSSPPSRMWKDLVRRPLGELRWRFANWDKDGRYCSHCSDQVRKGFVTVRRELYGRLGDFFFPEENQGVLVYSLADLLSLNGMV
ncbi:hypothetical protein FRC02_006216 [Tulasnella sp. 418]|nr:hypothetical protein FRC02_006216 [Tulasnella sp. 418]